MAKTPNQKVVTKKHLARLERERIQTRYVKIAAAAVIALVVLLIAYGVLEQTVLVANRPVARVGDEVITTREFQNQVRWTRYTRIQQYQQTLELAQFFGDDQSIQNNLLQIEQELSDSQTMGSQVLESLISSEIIRQEAQRRGITVTEAELDEGFEAFFRYYPKGTPTPEVFPTAGPTNAPDATQLAIFGPTLTPAPTATAGPEATVEGAPEATVAPTEAAAAESEPTLEPTSAEPQATATTAPTATPYTFEGFRSEVDSYMQALRDTGVNIDEEYLRKLIENNLYYKKLRDDMTADVETELEHIWVRHILVPDETIAALAMEQLNAGKNFNEVAATFSTDESNKLKGGDLGWINRETNFVQEFKDGAFALTEIGQISEPIQSSFGYHIIQLLGREDRPVDQTQLDTIRDARMQEWLTGELAKDTIVKYDTWQDKVPTEPVLPNTQG